MVNERTNRESLGRGSSSGEVLHVKDNVTLTGVDFCFAPVHKGTWKNYTYLDGLAGNDVFAIHEDEDGSLWFGTRTGVSRYDGKQFFNITTEDGLPNHFIRAIHRTSDGVLWFATYGDGIIRYDGVEFTTFTTADGLASNDVTAIHRTSDGMLWFGTGCSRDGFGEGGGVSRIAYPEQNQKRGKGFETFTTKDGLQSNNTFVIDASLDGMLWFAQGYQQGDRERGGISCYDGTRFMTFSR